MISFARGARPQATTCRSTVSGCACRRRRIRTCTLGTPVVVRETDRRRALLSRLLSRVVCEALQHHQLEQWGGRPSQGGSAIGLQDLGADGGRTSCEFALAGALAFPQRVSSALPLSRRHAHALPQPLPFLAPVRAHTHDASLFSSTTSLLSVAGRVGTVFLCPCFDRMSMSGVFQEAMATRDVLEGLTNLLRRKGSTLRAKEQALGAPLMRGRAVLG